MIYTQSQCDVLVIVFFSSPLTASLAWLTGSWPYINAACAVDERASTQVGVLCYSCPIQFKQDLLWFHFVLIATGHKLDRAADTAATGEC